MKKKIAFIVGFGAILTLGSCGRQVPGPDATSSAAVTSASTPVLTTSQKSESTTTGIQLDEVFEDYNGTFLWKITINQGDSIVYGGPAPTKSYDENGIRNTWTGGWDFPVVNVQDEYIYKPTYTSSLAHYTCRFYGDEAKTDLLYTCEVNYDDHASYGGASRPSKTATADYEYEFNGTWLPTLNNTVKSATDFVAQYDRSSAGLVYKTDESHPEDTSLTGYTGSSATTLYVPSHHAGQTVFAIDDNALSHHPEITEVYLSGGISVMGRYVFREDTALKKIHLSHTLPWGSGCLIGCTAFPADGWDFGGSLGKYEVSNGVLYSYYTDSEGKVTCCAREASYDPSLIVGQEVSPLGKAKDQSVIDNYCFYGRGITGINLPDNCCDVASHALAENPALTSISLPASVQEIEYNAFEDDSALVSVTFASASQLTRIYESAFEDDAALTEFALPTTVNTIDDKAFQGCVGLKSLAAGDFFIPASVREMGSQVFGNIGGLVIHCQRSSQPGDWSNDWAGTGNTVLWGQAS
jgi:hypothetical protein